MNCLTYTIANLLNKKYVDLPILTLTTEWDKYLKQFQLGIIEIAASTKEEIFKTMKQSPSIRYGLGGTVKGIAHYVVAEGDIIISHNGHNIEGPLNGHYWCLLIVHRPLRES